ncbi:MAG: hypothetical protein HY905_14790 [Deltaproteobacteria bacterium]|nr:hypothetical protein [Deltaproteobacteria bacterium]
MSAVLLAATLLAGCVGGTRLAGPWGDAEPDSVVEDARDDVAGVDGGEEAVLADDGDDGDVHESRADYAGINHFPSR